MIERAHPHDIPAILAIARARYGGFSEHRASQWLRDAMSNPEMVVLKSDHAVGVATMAQPFWGGPTRAHLLFLVCRRFPGLSRKGYGEGVAMMKALDHWRQVHGAESFHFGEETGANFRILARALGAEQESPTYRLGGTDLSFAAELFQQRAPTRDPRVFRSVLDQILAT